MKEEQIEKKRVRSGTQLKIQLQPENGNGKRLSGIKWSKMSSVQRAEAAFCLRIFFVQGGLLSLRRHSLKHDRIL